MKKFFSLLLVLVLAFALVACGKDEPAPVDPTPVDPTPAVPTYAPLQIDFKNKTGVTITGLYLYESGAEDKGSSLCIPEWPDKDADGDLYEFYAYIFREEGKTLDLFVEFADGTTASWPNLTVANYDKLSLKGGVDPNGWEQEACDDAEDIAAMDEVKASGLTSDYFYPDYVKIPFEIKNKTGQNITGFYFFEADGDAKSYNNMVEHLTTADGNHIDSWKPGKSDEGGVYVFGYFIRPVADTYCVLVEFEDGTSYVLEDLDPFTPDLDGHVINELSFKDAVDPDLTKVEYDDGDPEPLQYLADAVKYEAPVDGWVPAV